MTPKPSHWLAALAAVGGILLVAATRMATAEEAYSQPQLEQLAAPIALYPDDLVAQMLDAATHPQDVVEASRWRSTVGAAMSADQAAAAVQAKPWAASVKALVDIPDILYSMTNDLAWTEALGRAHAGQNEELLAAIQDLRRRAEAADHLGSAPQQQVEDDGQTITIEPATEDAFALPCYDPNLVFGDWPWSGYPPYDFCDMAWGPEIVFPTVVFVGQHWHHHHMHWHRRPEAGVAADVGHLATPAVRAAAPTGRGWIADRRIGQSSKADAGRGARAAAAVPERPPGVAVFAFHAGDQRETGHFTDRAAMPAFPAPPRFPAPPVISAPPVRMFAPAANIGHAFQSFPAPRAYAAPPRIFSTPALGRFSAPAMHAGGGHWRR
jgi:hypothetical protein